MLTTRGNFHHSKLPRLGAVGHIIGLPHHYDPRRTCMVMAYPLCDSADYRYSYGIHRIQIRFLDNGQEVWLSAIWFEEEGNFGKVNYKRRVTKEQRRQAAADRYYHRARARRRIGTTRYDDCQARKPLRAAPL
ncbi:MAG: hypothetical protein OHK0046_47600 [Anaerolineae bacterium]